ncbi:hypothetical protein MRX96_021297 [Rhipicephalus microplus]
MASGPTTAADVMPRLQGLVEELLLGTDGSAMERERIAAVVRDRVMATPLPTRLRTWEHGLGPLTLARSLGSPTTLRLGSPLRTSPATPVLETCSRRRSFLNVWRTSAS